MTARHAGRIGPLSTVVAANVRAEAARRGLTQADMARILGVSRMAMSDRYRGRTPWSIDDLEVVSMALHVPVQAWLARPGQLGGGAAPGPVRPYVVGRASGGGDNEVGGPRGPEDREEEPSQRHAVG